MLAYSDADIPPSVPGVLPPPSLGPSRAKPSTGATMTPPPGGGGLLDPSPSAWAGATASGAEQTARARGVVSRVAAAHGDVNDLRSRVGNSHPDAIAVPVDAEVADDPPRVIVHGRADGGLGDLIDEDEASDEESMVSATSLLDVAWGVSAEFQGGDGDGAAPPYSPGAEHGEGSMRRVRDLPGLMEHASTSAEVDSVAGSEFNVGADARVSS